MTVCPDDATVCEGTFPVVLWCVPVRNGSAPVIRDRTLVLAGVSTASQGSRTAKLRGYTVAYK